MFLDAQSNGAAGVEERAKARGIFFAAASCGSLCAAFTVYHLFSGHLLIASLLLPGIAVVAAIMWSNRKPPFKLWTAYLGTFYLLGLMAVVLFIGFADGASIMWMSAVPAVAIFALGTRLGLVATVIGLGMVVATLTRDGGFGNEFLTGSYSLRLVLAYFFTASVCFFYESSREKELRRLEAAQTRIATLEGLLPVCSWCKKIQSDEGDWQDLENYIAERAPVEFSHSICPSCTEKHFAKQ